MKRFLNNIALFVVISFTMLELTTRFITDPFFYYYADSFNEKPEDRYNVKDHQQADHVDYIFLGSSRVPAAISTKEFIRDESGKNAIMAGRGGNTFGVQYQALKHRLKLYPDYLKGTAVFLEYSGTDIYTKPFKEEEYKVYEASADGVNDAPQLLMPHLDNESFLEYLKRSHNSLRMRTQVAMLYTCAAYRSSYFVNDVYHKFDRPLTGPIKKGLIMEGGIRPDNMQEAMEYAKIAARLNAERLARRPALTEESLDKSALKALNDLIREHGGKLYLFRIPMHSIRSEVYNEGEKNINDNRFFESWLAEEEIPVLNAESFHYQDSDFPDIWHLAASRRDQFTDALHQSFVNRAGLKKE